MSGLVTNVTTGAPPTGAGWMSRVRYDDIDAQAAHFKGYGQQYQQLSRGTFEGRFRSFEFGGELAVHFEHANRELAQSAITPSGRFGACVLDTGSPICVLNAAPVTDGDVVLCPGRRTLEGKTPEGMSIVCLDLDVRLLPDDAAEMRRVGVLRDPVQSERLREMLHAGVHAFATAGPPTHYGAAARDFSASLADLLWQIAVRPLPHELRALRHSSARKLQVFRRARDYIHHGLPDGISITEACRSAGCSRRSLEGAFRSVIGMSPAHYVRVLQLNRIRRDLLSWLDPTESIGMIAARHGVWHWSRLAVYYRELFGELPSQTRRRKSQSHRLALIS